MFSSTAGRPSRSCSTAANPRVSTPSFLGRLEAGRHRISVVRNATYSAPGAALKVTGVAVRGGIDDPVIARAPVLYARKNTIGQFTDVPMIVYAEQLGGVLQYTVIFTDEDGGTSTRALMARWADHRYRVRLPARHEDRPRHHPRQESQGHRVSGTLQGAHPLLIPVTDNNMVGDEVPSEIRYQIAPVQVDLTTHSREQVMDDDPLTYQVMAKELEREGKVRPFGQVDGHKISDVRNYAYIEAKVSVQTAGIVAMLRRKDDAVWRVSSLGRWDYAVDRDGWIRTTVELPPGTRATDLGEIGFTCVVVPDDNKKLPITGTCRIENVSKVFLLDRNNITQARVSGHCSRRRKSPRASSGPGRSGSRYFPTGPSQASYVSRTVAPLYDTDRAVGCNGGWG